MLLIAAFNNNCPSVSCYYNCLSMVSMTNRRPAAAVLDVVVAAGIGRFRGRRAGRNMQRNISVVTTRYIRSTREQWHDRDRPNTEYSSKRLTVIISDRPIDSECSVVSAGTARGVNSKRSLCRPTVRSGRKVNSGLNVNNLIQPQLLRHVIRPSVSLTCGTLNVRSLRHKVDAMDDMISTNKLDVLGVTESWHEGTDCMCINKLHSLGYTVI